jgi:DNA-binding transcriptional LysR family regulator
MRKMANELRSFESISSVLATARAGTPLKAATSLACAPSTVYRAIERLEKAIGASLFDRITTGWRPTDLGRRIIRLAETIDAEVIETELFLLSRSKNISAPLRISASDGFAEGYLAPILANFSKAKHAFTIELIVDNHFADLARREADIAVRPDQKPGEGLVGRRVGKLAHALYCATPLIEKHGMPASVAELSRFKACVLSHKLQHHTSARWWNAAVKKQVEVALITNTEMGLAAAISAGVGVGVLPCFLGDQLDGVKRVTTISVGAPVDIWIVTHASLRQNRAVRSLTDALASAMQRDAAKLAGMQNR